MEATTHVAYKHAREQVFRFKTYLDEAITFADKRKQKPLQAADTLAYDFNKMFRLRIADPQAKLRKSLDLIQKHCPFRGIEWSKDWMERFFVKRTR